MSVLVFASFGLMLMKAAGHMAAVENPVHRISTEERVAIFSSAGQEDERRLQQTPHGSPVASRPL